VTAETRQWYLDAMSSHGHPQRRANARQRIAAAINARNRTEP
jgi:hypothetical protein